MHQKYGSFVGQILLYFQNGSDWVQRGSKMVPNVFNSSLD